MRRFLAPLLGIAALGLLAAGCAGQPSVATGNPSGTAILRTSEPSRPDLPSVHLPPGSEPVAGSKVNASALPAGYPRLVWTQGDGSTIGFFAEQGACTTVSASVVSQTDSAVTVRLLIIQQATTKPCPQYLINKEMTVKLDRPLGSRTVIMQAAIERG